MNSTMVNFSLATPLPFINVEAVGGCWEIQYPSSMLTWILYDVNNVNLTHGYWQVPSDVIAQWTDNDDVITDALLEAQPWIVVAPPQPEENI